MANVNITEQVHRVTVQEDGSVHVASIGIKGPKGDKGDPGDADMGDVDAHMAATTDVHGIADSAELATLTDLANVEIDTSIYDDHLLSTEDVHGILDTAALETQSGAQSKADDAVTAHDVATGVHGVATSTVASADDVSAAQSAAQDHADSAVSDHNAATSVHGVDTTQLATQADVDAVLPEPTVDGDVLTLADGSPTWAAPEGGGGAGIAPRALWHPGRTYDPLHYGLPVSSVNTSATAFGNFLMFSAIPIPNTSRIVEMAMQVQSASAGNTVRFGMFHMDPTTGLPGDLEIDVGEFSADTSGVKSIVLDYEFAPGWYWFCFHASANVVLEGWTLASNYTVVGRSGNNIDHQRSLFQSRNYGPLPSSVSPPFSYGNHPNPWFWLTVASQE